MRTLNPIGYGLLYLFAIGVCVYAKDCLADCDQVTYDQVYTTIANQALMEMKVLGEKVALENRYQSVIQLRKLCKGQRSSYETNNPMNKPHQGRNRD